MTTPSPKDYQITGQKLDHVVNAEGNGFSQQWNVGYLVTDGPAAGTKGEIHVPTNQLTADVVHGAIRVMVAKHQEVAGY
jgi:hypothetical protein